MPVVSVSRMLAGFAVGLVVALPLQAQDKVEPKQKESKSGQTQC